jgi:1,4-dihydroxy-2-naphthoyl-CoA hydrolase
MTDAEPVSPTDIDLSHGLFGDLGAEYEEISADRVVGVLDIETRHHQPYGLVHGGVYCALVETTASTGAALWAFGRGYLGAVGVSNTTDFLRSHRTGRIRAVATPIRRGRLQQLWEVAVTRDSDGAELARGKVRMQNLVDPEVIGGNEFRPSREEA